MLIVKYSDVVMQPGRTNYFYPFKYVAHETVLIFAIKNACLYCSVDITENSVVQALEVRPNYFTAIEDDYKGKAVQSEAWSVAEGSRKLRFPDYMTTAQDCGKVVSHFYRQEILLVLISVRG